MLMSGHRHPFYTKYRVGFNKDGLIKALDTDIYNNAGYSLDLSFSVMHRAMFHVDNAYNVHQIHSRKSKFSHNLLCYPVQQTKQLIP